MSLDSVHLMAWVHSLSSPTNCHAGTPREGLVSATLSQKGVAPRIGEPLHRVPFDSVGILPPAALCALEARNKRTTFWLSGRESALSS